jgi:D-alanyl-lipoteichoic acid acyltransferase DltB (MBOAT superfamily)
MAGPIVRYETVADEITGRRFNLDDFSRGVKRFIIGLSKKVIIANAVAVVADRAFTNTDFSTLTVLMAWIGIVCYTLQIYFDFSGYSDMAIGLGLMFGFHFLENFNYPYVSKTVTEFWRRWHISLSSWFRDYVYFPLGGSRVKSKRRLVLNLFIVWTLTGIWHGASWNFVVWGFFYFVLLTFEKLMEIPQKLKQRHVFGFLYRIFTILCVMIGWVFFRAEGLRNAVKYLFTMIPGVSDSAPLYDVDTLYVLSQNWIVIVVAVVLCTPVLKLLVLKLKNSTRNNRIGTCVFTIENIVFMGLFFVSVAFTVTSSYNPFIYFNF